MKLQKIQSGFTLVEMLLYSVTVAFILVSVGTFLLIVMQNKVKNTSIAEVEQQGEFVMHLLTQEIRNAETVTLPIAQSTSDSLTLDIFDVANDPLVFSLSGTALQMTEAGGNVINLTSDRIEVSSLSFEHLSNNIDHSSVKIEFTLTHLNPLNRQEWDYQQIFISTASLR